MMVSVKFTKISIFLGLFLSLGLEPAVLALPNPAETAVNETSLAPSADIKSVLGRQLSPEARIVLPSDDGFNEATSRWSTWYPPSASAVVLAKVESDIVNSLRYANKVNKPFLLMNAGHGWTNFNATKNVLVIRTDTMDTAVVNTKKNTITLGPGMTVEAVMNVLYEKGKQMPTGSCSCAGMMGVMLGGGHGRLQGLHGLISDNLISARVLLASGSVITVSETQNSELMFALRGAGHNFGIVLSATFKIYDAVNNGQHYNAVLTYKPEQASSIFASLNKVTLPAAGSIYVIYYWDNAARQPVVLLDFVYAGPKEEGSKWVADNLSTLPSITKTEEMIPWNKVNARSANQIVTVFCERGKRNNMFTASMLEYKPDDMQTLLTDYTSFLQDNPAMVNSSYLFESYPTQAVRDFNASTAAYANRDANIIALLTVAYQDEANDALADAYGFHAREIMRSHSGFNQPRAYLNYARGDEPTGSYYGYEPWRVQKLASLKKKYDPYGKFNSYHPVDVRV